MNRISDWARKRWDARAPSDEADDPALEFDGDTIRLSEVTPRVEAKTRELKDTLRALGADRRTLRMVDELEGLVGV
ncbi:hypothetical protein [Microbacterium sp. Marseille-Q6648]|uniref:hypothetical protein n=1 Tax=Microbacterium sp. Marseille-Q6648 TaxID=2937991 RepID=UPI00203A4AAF|nr:hypothetical protein [Microbacterium sp. Marseille-Q6648]